VSVTVSRPTISRRGICSGRHGQHVLRHFPLGPRGFTGLLSGALVSFPLLPFVGDQPVLSWRPPELRGRTLGGLVSLVYERGSGPTRPVAHSVLKHLRRYWRTQLLDGCATTLIRSPSNSRRGCRLEGSSAFSQRGYRRRHIVGR